MSLMMPDGKSWTQPYQNPYASQPQQQPFGRVNSTAQPGQQTPGQGGIPQDAIFRSPTPSTGGTKAPDMSAYAPGKAQPVQQQPTGTPYGQQPAQQDNPYANMAPGVYYGGQQIPGNQQQALQAAMAQRDAMAVLVNNNNLQYQMANAFGQDLGRPQFDYGSAVQQAQNMVANGFYNPFTQYYNQATDPVSQLGQYAPPPMYSPPQPFPPIGGFGVQQPQQPAPAPPEYSSKQVPGSEWDQVQQAWMLPAKPQQQQASPMSGSPTQPAPDQRIIHRHGPGDTLLAPQGPFRPGTYQPQPIAPQQPPRTSPTTPTSGNWIQRPDGQWEEMQPQMYGGVDPVLMAPKEAAEDERRYLQYKQGTAQPIQPPSRGAQYEMPSRPAKPSAEQAALTRKRLNDERARLDRERKAREVARQRNQWATNQQYGNSAVIAWNRLQGR